VKFHVQQTDGFRYFREWDSDWARV